MADSKHYYSDTNKRLVDWMNETVFTAMITIKFMSPENDNYNITQLEKVIRNMNKYIYGRHYNKKNLFINGFVSIEKNIKKSPNKFHTHLLIKNDNKVSRFSISELLDIAIKSSKSIKDTKGNNAFIHGDITQTINNDGVAGLQTDCFHIIEAYDEFAAGYITKTVTDTDNDQIKILSCNGLSDRDLSFIKNKNLW